MSVKKPALGRGLGALLGESAARQVTANAAAVAAARPPVDELTKLPLDLLQRGKYQPRSDMRQDSLTELAESIKAQGIVQPIVVRPIGGAGPTESQRYEIIAGERRWRAAQLAGLTEIPAVVRHVPDEAAVAMSLIENIQREDLNPLEEARALDRLVSEFSLTHQEAAAAVGRSRATVSNLLRLLELADEVKALVANRAIEMGHARALLGLANKRQQVEAANEVAKRGLSVRETEAIVRRLLTAARGGAAGGGGGGGTGTGSADADVRRLETELSEKLGAKVAFKQGGGGKGQLVISYSSHEELEGILAHIR
jgi:ParB family chromosome partitioning protein